MQAEVEFLYRAMSSPLGIVISVSDFTLASQRLYAARRKLDDQDLSCLQIRRSPVKPEDELWIVKGPANAKK